MTAQTLTPPMVNTSAHQEEEAHWQAVLSRDPNFNGAFVYAVRSTGIYCRPTCPSRKPGRPQVVFFPVPEAAEQAGFRACRRCLPQQRPSSDPHIELVRRVCQCIQENLDESSDKNAGTLPTLAQLGDAAGVSPYHLQRVFKQVMGVTPRQYADSCRLNQLKTGIKNDHSLTDALYLAGYGSSSRLYEQASGQLGMTPGGYQRSGKGMQIAYTVVDSPLGLLLVAATQRGICAVSLGDSEAYLTGTLRQEYSAAEVRRDDAILGRWVDAIVEHLAGRLPRIDVPLDIRATAFERLVWEKLRRIPYGETRSYGEIAQTINQPKAARAAAKACSKNPVAVVIPCHRVIRQDGGLGGYRWGITRKEALLAQEQGLSL
ncbi:MAG: bifunctional DNA-binding transcriptional regulator/O6-methylguanine-DNA methyltransferase Ada [Chloroflexi bacterium]|nr:bifunctional DNA-binding transcriptional regulator/O6-methylguanine-DNA methyltransferase Ada [Chloroflexota bacterium]